MKFLKLLTLIACLGGCKTLGQSLSQTFSSSGQPVSSHRCEEEEPSPAHRPLLAYIKAQLKILKTYSPKLFADDQESCFHIINSQEIETRLTTNGTITLSLGVLKASETDAQFAAWLAHVLAHQLKKHASLDLREFVNLHPDYQKPYHDLTLEKQAIKRFDIPAIGNEPAWNDYREQLRDLSFQKWSQVNLGNNPMAKTGLICETVKTWEKISAARQAIIQKLPASDYEENLCQQFFQEFNLDEKLASLLTAGKEKEADQVGVEIFLNAAYPEDEYPQFFSNVLHLGGQKSCRNQEKDPGDCWRTKSIRPEMKAYLKTLDHPKAIRTHQYPVDLAELKEALTAP